MSYRTLDEVVRTEVVVIGGGIAGMTAALNVAPLSAVLVTKKSLGDGSSSRLAQGGMAVALGVDDSPDLHARDTLAVGGGISNDQAVKLITSQGPDQIARLKEIGAEFDSTASGDILLGREAAHSRRRIVHAQGDSTGAEIVRALVEHVRNGSQVQLIEQCHTTDLLVRNGRVVGVLARLDSGRWIEIEAGAVVLATGGCGSVYKCTTNPPESTGDGLAMAARIGARLVDLEFVQFHPTALACETNPMPLLTEALRGEGAVLIDSEGCRFMLDEHPSAELAPRDIVSRAIWSRLNQGLTAYLDATQAVGMKFPERFPTVFGFCESHGYDPRSEPVPVSPAAHYHIGGVATDSLGRTSVSGLWACGETAATGVHGANRLASNSLLEASVFGVQVAEDIRGNWRPIRSSGRALRFELDDIPRETREILRQQVRELMWEKVGLVRNEASLTAALERIQSWEAEFGGMRGETANILTVSKLISGAALARRESRGVHFRSDYPTQDPTWARHLDFSEPEFDPVPAVALAR